MLTFSQALELAETWVRIVTGDRCVILKKHTVKRPYGWVFFYQSREYVASGDSRYMVAGNAPILVDRVNAEIRVTGTADPLEKYLEQYEETILPARMQISMPTEP